MSWSSRSWSVTSYDSSRMWPMLRNRRNAAAFCIEREKLQDLPVRRTTDFVEEEARVTRCGTFTVRAILSCTAPRRD